MKNTCGKTVKRENAYEVWSNGSWTWYCLKKYQNAEQEAKNPFSRWFCEVVTPMCPDGELGDTYVKDIKSVAVRIK